MWRKNTAGASSSSLASAPTLRTLAYEIGAETVGLLRRAAGAWSVLDEGLALEVIADAEPSRLLQRRFLAELLQLSGVPVESAVDLGMLARAYERRPFADTIALRRRVAAAVQAQDRYPFEGR